MNYGKAVRIARAAAGLEQKQLASAAGLNASHISLIEKGSRQPSTRTIAKLSQALNMPVALFNMLAAEAADLRGIEEQDFQRIGVYLTKFLVCSEYTQKRSRAKRRT